MNTTTLLHPAPPTELPFTADAVRQRPPRRGIVTVVANLKGGVSKTTTSVNVACALARGIRTPRGKQVLPPRRVLLIDTEPLTTASTWLGVTAGPMESAAALLADLPEGVSLDARETTASRRWESSLLSLSCRAAKEPLDVIPAETAAIELADAQKGESEYTLRDNLEYLRSHYDHIIIDTPANAKNRFLRSALIAADGVVIPVQPTSAVATSLVPLFKIFRDIQRGANPRLKVWGVLISCAGSRGDRDAAVALRALENTGLPVFRSMIRTLKSIQRSASARCSVFGMGDAEEAMRDYQAFVMELLARMGDVTVDVEVARG